MNTERPDDTRKISLAAGALFLVTFITSITALGLFQPVLDDPAGYIAGAGHDNRIFLAVVLEMILIAANIGTAVVLFPLLKRQSEMLSMGYVTARIIECTFIAAGILSVLGIVSLRRPTLAPRRSRSRSPKPRTGRSCWARGWSSGSVTA